MTLKKFCLVSNITILFYCFTGVYPTNAQIVPDSTTNTSVINNCANSCNITGGKQSGQNLFHSFSDFNLQTEESAYFSDPGVTNIFSRVTGSNPSNIFGTLGVLGDANLFLLNPNGIIFGEGGALDLNGSFLATTANEIQFGENGSFSTSLNSQENLALLTINPDVIFFVGQNRPITTHSGSSLIVNEGQNITMLAGQTAENTLGIDIQGSFLQTPQGSINLGAIAGSGKIKLKEGWQLESNDTFTGDISISGESVIDVTGAGGGSIEIQGNNISLTEQSHLSAHTLGNIDGGSIEISAQNFTVTDNSQVVSSTVGAGNSPDINIEAQKQVQIIGNDVSAFQSFLFNTVFGGDRSNNSSSVVYSFSAGSGQAGNIIIDSQDLTVANGAWILASTLNDGITEDLTINATGNVTIDGSGVILGSALNSSGNVSQLNLHSNNLIIQNGGIISSSTLGSGLGGNINLTISDSVYLKESLASGLAPTGIYSSTVQGTGKAGDIDLNTSSLILEDGSQLSSSSGFVFSEGLISSGGQGGNISIKAQDRVQILGASSNGIFSSGIVNNTFSDRPAGDISIQTGSLNLEGQGTISASAIGSGNGGDLDIVADESINLAGLGLETLQQSSLQSIGGDTSLLDSRIRGGLLTDTIVGEAGNISISTPQLTIENGALISTATFGAGRGGNLNLATENLEIFASAVTSATANMGQAGNIDIETNSLTIGDSGAIISSSAGLGNAGDITINARDSIEALSNQDDSLLPGGIYSSSVGLAYQGNLAISTKDLTILDGNQINATNGTNNELLRQIIEQFDFPESSLEVELDKNITINAESIKIARNSGGLFSNTGIFTRTFTKFPASNILINTSELSIASYGELSVNSTGEGKAGNLTIFADNLALSNGSKLNATTLSGQGGNIHLNINNLLDLNDRASIKTDASGIGNGGNINVDTTFAIASGNSIISAQAVSGQGGNINIVARDLFIAPDSLITASATTELGIDGKVEIETFNITNRHSLVKLPEITIKADHSIVPVCGSHDYKEGGFSYTGKGGLPGNPLTEYNIGDHNLLEDFALSPESESTPDENWETGEFELRSPIKIVEAASWKVNLQGRIELIAKTDSRLQQDIFASPDCPFIN